jgi:hypothetical protein
MQVFIEFRAGSSAPGSNGKAAKKNHLGAAEGIAVYYIRISGRESHISFESGESVIGGVVMFIRETDKH